MSEESELTEREMLVAKHAAKLAVREIQDEFYRQVGKGLVTRIFIWVGLAAVAFAAGKGWVKLP